MLHHYVYHVQLYIGLQLVTILLIFTLQKDFFPAAEHRLKVCDRLIFSLFHFLFGLVPISSWVIGLSGSSRASAFRPPPRQTAN
jgi:hypothetical protein